ncbi:uncharacterized protein BT62DRAFT_931935 [Guyanagaster necrorhizus]|uniref:Uncharacterized protein n=1 Tax=Guyanagaster necrorhizus TaxID=856835 RepID=A0A9P7VS96_9AGAR|nr:uncharacterized protein BT62DRAFT_931935 [Guyanagaster necrorhizus MCA 3950]KAG7446503.1 hypothetical protein BT62DRAFT_931935 [Guyanagaster necrorhizus MCA 3950]
MDRLRRAFKISSSSATKRNVPSANAKSTKKDNLKHTKSMPIRSSLYGLEYSPNNYPPSPTPRNIIKSAKIYTSRFTPRTKPAASQPVPKNVNADLQEEEDYENVLDIHSGVTVITREDLDAFPMPPDIFPPNPPKLQAFYDAQNEERRRRKEQKMEEQRARYGYKTVHGNASTPTVYHHGSTRQKLTSSSTVNVSTASHRGRSRFSKPLPPCPGDWQQHLNSPSTTSLHPDNQTHTSRHRQGSTTSHRSRSRATPSHQRVQEHSKYMTEQGMASYPDIEALAAVRRGHAVFQQGSDHRKSHRVEMFFNPDDEPVPVNVGQIQQQVDDYLSSQNLAPG